MKNQLLQTVRWVLLVTLGLLTIYKLLILFVLSGALVPRSSWFGLVCVVALCKVPAVTFSFRSRVPVVLAGLVDWLVTIWVFQIQERRATFGTALQNSFLDLAFLLLALLYLVVPKPQLQSKEASLRL